MSQRIGLGLVVMGLSMILAVVGVLLTDGLQPGRIAPGFAALGAAAAGVALVLGLHMLEHGRDNATTL